MKLLKVHPSISFMTQKTKSPNNTKKNKSIGTEDVIVIIYCI